MLGKKNILWTNNALAPIIFGTINIFFTAVEGGVLMEDLLHYKLPLGPLGSLANAVLVKNQLKDIFNYRQQVLENKFGKM